MAGEAWEDMIEKALSKDIKVILLTPTWDNTFFEKNEDWHSLVSHKNQIIKLAEQYKVGLADSFSAFEKYVAQDDDLVNLLSHCNHPSRVGHELVANEIAKYFLAR